MNDCISKSRPRWHARSLVILGAVGLAATGCSKGVIAVPTGPHHPQAEASATPVTEPPPPARIEVVPLRRNPECQYLDGHFHPEDGTWRWIKGKWVLPPRGCYYAPPTTGYEAVAGGTTLVFREGAWLKRGSPPQRCPDALSCPSPIADLDEK